MKDFWIDLPAEVLVKVLAEIFFFVSVSLYKYLKRRLKKPN